MTTPLDTPQPTRWRGVPAPERQAERRRLLIAAAFDSLGTAGLTGTTVRGVCEAAKLNARYFYESFADLDALLVAVYDEVSHAAFAAILEGVAPILAAAAPGEPDPSTLIHATIGSFVRHVTDDPRRARVLFIEGLGNEALTRRRHESMRNLTFLLEQDAAAKAGVGDDPVVKVAANLMVGGMAELLIAWLQGDLDVSLDQLVDNAAPLFVATAEAAAQIASRRAQPTRPGRRPPREA